MRSKMFIIVIAAVAVITHSYSADTKQKEQAVKLTDNYTPEESQALHNFLKHYNPTADRCRPTLRAVDGSFGERESLLAIPGDDVNGVLACMLAGHKNVALFEDLDHFNRADVPIPLQRVLQRHTIMVARIDRLRSCVYTPQGRTYAFLAIKYFKEMPRHGSDYLAGKLFGYADEDIYALYLKNSNGVRAEATKFFEHDKKTANQWIDQNEPGIEQWIEKKKIKIMPFVMP